MQQTANGTPPLSLSPLVQCVTPFVDRRRGHVKQALAKGVQPAEVRHASLWPAFPYDYRLIFHEFPLSFGL